MIVWGKSKPQSSFGNRGVTSLSMHNKRSSTGWNKNVANTPSYNIDKLIRENIKKLNDK